MTSLTRELDLNALFLRLSGMSDCRTPADLHEQLVACVQALGFEWYNYNGRFKLGASKPVQHSAVQLPSRMAAALPGTALRPDRYNLATHAQAPHPSRLGARPFGNGRAASVLRRTRTFRSESGISFPTFSPTGDPGIFSLGSSDPTHSQDTLLKRMSRAWRPRSSCMTRCLVSSETSRPARIRG